MSKKEKLLLMLVELLMQERDCLRSVLSEWDEDKSCYVQWNRARDLEVVIDSLYCTSTN